MILNIDFLSGFRYILFFREKGAAFWEKSIAFNWQALSYGSIHQTMNRLIFTPVSRTDGRYEFFSAPAHVPDWTSILSFLPPGLALQAESGESF